MIRTQRLAATESRPAQGEGRRRDFVFYSGAVIDRYDWWNDEEYTIQFSLDPADFDLSTLTGAPLLKDHRQSMDSLLGHVENARIENGVAVATAVFAETPDVDTIWAKVAAGHASDVSMGVNIERLELTSKKGEKKAFLARGWKPHEVSVVPIGADPGAAFLSGARHEDFPVEVREFLRGLYKQHLAKAGAASTADTTGDANRVAALMALRQRRYEHITR